MRPAPDRRLSASQCAVCVPCFNEERRVPALLDALAHLDPAPGVVLAVDDGSTDGTARMLEAAGIEVVRHAVNQGLGAARNTLWQAARARGFAVVVYLDADVSPPGDWLRQIGELLGPDAHLAGVGGRNVDPLDDGGARADQWRARFWPQDLGRRPLTDAPMLVGACATYRVEALRDVGGFDPRFRTNGEDVDIGRRLRAAGHRLLYRPELVVQHRRRDDAASLVDLCYRHCRDGMRATLKTPGEPPRAAELVLGMARKAAWAPAAALLKRRDPAEAALALVACGAGLAGYAVGMARP